MSGVDDEVSTQTDVSALVFPNDSENLEQIFDHLCDNMRTLCNEISQLYKEEQHASAVLNNTEKTVVMPEQSSLFEKKTRIINKLTAEVKDSKTLGNILSSRLQSAWNIS